MIASAAISKPDPYYEGKKRARYCIMNNHSGFGLDNPYPRDTSEHKQWQIGFDHELRSEQP
jgi:hypothetical protein